MLIKPTFNNIVVDRDEAGATSPGGILLPESAKECPKAGTVRGIGPGRYTEAGQLVPVCCAVGDRILFAAYAGSEIEVGDERLLIMKDEDVLAVVE